MRRIVQGLRRALSVEPGEGALVVWSAVTLFLVESASVAVSNVSDTLFLKRVGVEYLPIVFLVNSVLLTATTFVVGRVAVRFEQRRLLTVAFVMLAVALFALWMLVVTEAPGIATTLVIVSKQIDVIALLLFWTMVTALMTSRQSKRLVALMTAGGTLGTIAGSFASGPFGRVLGIPSLLGIAGLTFAIAAIVSVPLAGTRPPRLYRVERRALPEQQPRLGEFWRDSSLFRMLVGTSFLAGVLGPMLYFEFSRAADLATQTADGEQKLLALYGMLRGWINVGVLVVQIGFSALLFRLIGVPAAAALAPAAYVLGFTGLGLRFGLATAMPAAMSTSVLDHTIYEPALRVLAALLPPRFRVAATSMIQGPAKRAGAAIGSFLVLVVVAVGDPSAVAFAALPIAGLWMLLALTLWRHYPTLLLEAASVRPSETEAQEAIVPFLDPGTRRTLQRNLEGSDPVLCGAACALFVDAPRGIAVEALARAIPRAPAANRGILLDALDHVLNDPGATQSVDGALCARIVLALETAADLAPTERAKLLQVLGRIGWSHAAGARVRDALEHACEDASEGVRAVARIAVARHSATSPKESLDAVLTESIASGDPAVRRVAVAEMRYELLRGADDGPLRNHHLTLLTEHLQRLARATGGGAGDESVLARLRAEAVEVLADVAVAYPNAVAPSVRAVLSLADDPDASVRSAVLRFVGNAGLGAHAHLLAERLSSRSAEEAAAARCAIERLGPGAADALLHALRHGGRRAREVIPGILRDLRADPAVLQALVDREIDSTRELLVVLGVFDATGQSRLVLQRLRERVDESLHCALELVAALLGDDRIANVCRTLGRGWNVRDRAVLLEALEVLLPATERARILPLLEDQSAQRLAVAAAQALGRPWPTLEQAIVQTLESHDPLTTTLVVATADRALLTKVMPELDVEAALRISTPAAGDVPAGRSAAGGGPVPAPAAAKEATMRSPVEKMLHLRTLDLFEGLSTRQLSELARVAREVTVPPGQAIVTEGEFDDSMYFIVSGTVRITREGRLIAETGPRDFFGEMAVFDGERRSATATSVGEVALLRLARSDLFEVMEDQPAIGIGLCQTLSRRLRNLLDERTAASPSKG